MTPHPNETPEPLAQGQAGEMKTVAYLVTNLSSGEPSLCFEDERGDYGDEDHMPVFDELCRRSEFTAALQAKDAEIAGLKADAGRYRWIKADEGDGFRLIQIQFAAHHYDEKIDDAMKGEAA